MTSSMLQKSDLRGYQQRTVTALYEADALQLVVGMGGGKTATALTAIRELIDDGVIRRALVIAPRLVASQVWPNEPAQWQHLHDMRVKLVDGNATRRMRAFLEPADVYVIGINHVPWLVKYLAVMPHDHPLFDLLCIDELSKLKSPNGSWGKKLTSLADRWRIRWGLTGTPRPNGYLDQFRPLTVLTAGKLWGANFHQWRETNFRATDFKRYNWVIRQNHEPSIIRKIGSVTVTIADDEMPDLPPLTSLVHWVDLPKGAREIYDDMEKDLFAEFDNDPNVLAANSGVASGKLAQVSQGFMYSGPARIRLASSMGSDVNYLHNEKMEMLQELVEQLDGQPTLIAYEFVEDLRRINEAWPDLKWLGNEADSEANIAAWNAGEVPLLALNPASAAHGLNLQHGGSHLILYGMPWSSELYDQLIKRFYRPGQEKHCFVHHILARDTIDQVKFDRVHNKMEAQDAFKKYLRKV